MTALGHLFAVVTAFLAAFVPTHQFSYFAPSVTFTRQATVLVGGDMMFDRSIRTAINEKGGDFIFSCIDQLLASNDLVVANLEGPITATSSRSEGSVIGAPDNFTFTFPMSTADLLAAHNIRLVNLGNNHIFNFGTDGLHSTTQALTGADVGYFGDPLTQTVAERNIKGVRLAFINYNEFEHSSTASTTIAQIREEKSRGDLALVYTHWGIEYATTSPAHIHTLAHEFIDAGADIVIGSHPHVVEEHEMYEGKNIYYSLGNFIFDQYWNADVTHGLLLRLTLTPTGLQAVQEIPVELGHDRRTCPSS